VLTALPLMLLCAAAEPTVPVLKARPKLDGTLAEWTGAQALKTPEGLTAWVGVSEGAMQLAVKAVDATAGQGDLLEVALYFPEAGTTDVGLSVRVGADGLRGEVERGGGLLTPEGTRDAGNAVENKGGAGKANDSARSSLLALQPGADSVRSAQKRTSADLSFELAIPVRAFQPFPARGPLRLVLCLSYQDRDGGGATSGEPRATCAGGAMQEGAMLLPESLRAALKLSPPAPVKTLQARPGGWVGFDGSALPRWVSTEKPLTRESLAQVVSDSPASIEAAGVVVPARFELGPGKPLLPVLVGRPVGSDPDAPCVDKDPLRLGLYLGAGKLAHRVLDWPAGSCAMGRLLSIALGEEGELVLGYSGGSTLQFIWSQDHFEQTQYGSLRPPAESFGKR
jgi:hypothetical protein